MTFDHHALIARLGNEAGAREEFERLIAALVGLSGYARRVHPAPGDWGIDVFVGALTEGSEIAVWQAKFFTQGVGDVQRRQIRASFEAARIAAENHGYRLTSWTLCIPIDMSPQDTQWWDRWKRAQEEQYKVEVGLWDKTALDRLLGDPALYGIRDEFFPHFALPARASGRPLSFAQLQQQREEDFASHWLPRARGVESEGEPGCLFTGRRRVLTELVGYLQGRADGTARVVTGQPGCGKSAVLARLVVLSSREHRQEVPLDQIPKETILPEGIIDVAVHARGKWLPDVTAELAASAGVPSSEPGLLMRALAARPKPLVVVIDALDEAVEAASLARQLLRPLTHMANVRLLIGTAKPLLGALGSSLELIDLDDSAYLGPVDIRSCVETILCKDALSSAATAYRTSPKLARQVAAAVAKRADPNFLIAQLTARSLAERSEAVDVSRSGWEDAFPATVGDAFEAYLDRFGEDAERVRSLLRPLAYAEGSGLPWNDLWAPLASHLSGRPIGDADVDWLLRQASAFIQSMSKGRSGTVYRLFHDALAEHLRPSGRERETQRRIVTTLVEQIPEAAARRDWLRADPYIRSYLASHAAAAGLLDDFLLDPLFLAAAEPGPLLHVLAHAATDEGQQVAAVYVRAAHLMPGQQPTERASYLEMVARQCNDQGLAERISRAFPRRSWAVLWAHWRSGHVHQIIGRHIGQATAVAVAEIDGQWVVVSGGHDGEVRVWDLDTGNPIRAPLACGSWVSAIDVGYVEGGTILVAAGSDGTMRRWDLATGDLLGEPVVGHHEKVTALAIGELQGRAVVVSGSLDGTIRRWDLVSGASIGAALGPYRGPHDSYWHRVFRVAVAVVAGRPLIVSGGIDGFVRRWDLATGEPIGKPLTFKRIVDALAVGQLADRPVAVCGSASGSGIFCYDLADGQLIRELSTGTSQVHAMAVGDVDGHPVVISGDLDGSLRPWDLATGEPVGEPLVGHEGPINAIATARVDAGSVAVSAAMDGTVRRWDLRTSTVSGEPLQDRHDYVAAVDVCIDNGLGIVVVARSSDGTLHRFDMATGEVLGVPLLGDPVALYAVAASALADRPLAVSGGQNGTLRRWDLESGEAIGPPLAGHVGAVLAVAVISIDGDAMVVSGGADCTVRRWSLLSGASIGAPIAAHNREIRALAAGKLGDRAVAVSGSSDGSVHCWDLGHGSLISTHRTGHPDWVRAVAITKIGSRVIGVSGCDDGLLRRWDLTTGEPIGEPLVGHHGWIRAITAGELHGRPVVVTGGVDGKVVRWNIATGERLHSMDLGASISALQWTPSSSVIVGADAGCMAVRVG